MKKKTGDIKFSIAAILATYFNIGNIKYAPGTFGSLATFPLFFILNYIFIKCGVSSLWQLALIYAITLAILVAVAFWSINIYISTNKKNDPSEVVIDEVVGQMIAFMIPVLLTIYYLAYVINYLSFNFLASVIVSFIIIIAPIMFFRIFDILKPGLVGYFDEKVAGAKGIIMDDVVAGLYAAFIVSLILTLFFVSVGCFY